MDIKEIKKKRLFSIIAIIISLPLSLVGAASQDMFIGVVFGFALCLGIDGLIESFNNNPE